MGALKPEMKDLSSLLNVAKVESQMLHAVMRPPFLNVAHSDRSFVMFDGIVRASDLLAKLHRLYMVISRAMSRLIGFGIFYLHNLLQDSMVWIRARVGITWLQEIHEPVSTCFSLRSFHFMLIA